jgi:hypothetical protein
MADFPISANTRAKGEELARLRKQAADLFAQYRTADGLDMPAEAIAEARRLNDAIAQVAAAYEEALNLDRMAHENDRALKDLTGVRLPVPPGAAATPTKTRTLRELFESKAAELRSMAAGSSGKVSWTLYGAEAKTLLSLQDIAPLPDRQPVAPSPQFFGDVTPLFTPGTTDSNVVDFYEETTFTNAATEIGEGQAAPEAALGFTLRTNPVQEIATYIPVSRRLLEDYAALDAYVRGRLALMVAIRRSRELIQGDGVAPHIRGVLNVTGVQTLARGSDPTPDAIFKAITLIRTNGDAEPTGAIFHPIDWQNVKLLRTVDGLYIWGSPSEAAPDRIWGLQVVVSNAVNQGSALVGAFRPWAQLFSRDELTIEVSTEHSTYFVERKAAVLAYERLTLAVYRPAAFCQVTGL